MFRHVLAAAALLIALAGLARAGSGPAEAPPDDFAGDQYIDSTGCVFSRGERDWIARLDRKGAPVCGYPPSLAQRVAGSAGIVLAGPQQAGPIPIEQALAAVLAEGLQDGEWISDQRDRQHRVDVPTPPPRKGAAAELPALVSALPQVQAAMAAPVPMDSRLCVLLGYDEPGNALPGIGIDSTQGYCRGATAALPTVAPPAITATTVEAAVVPVDNTASAAREEAEAAPQADPAKRPPLARTKPATRSGAQSLAAQRGKPAPTGITPEMVPHWARYVMLGNYENPARANQVLRAVAALGYPVAQGRQPARDGRVILAGPFADRRDLVAALNDLRSQGYGSAVAR